jgi:hypothetical protein
MTQSAFSPAQRQPATARDLHWIRGALQSAVAIEHATMPLYSAAMYSLEVQNYPAYNTLRSVLMEEMLHMAAACNALAAIGGAPRIKSLDPTAIHTGMPGTVAPGLTARFARLSRKQLDTFMRIESPLELLPADQQGLRYPTIGSFYTEIKTAIEANADLVAAAIRGRRVANQVGGNLGYAVIDPKGSDPVGQILASLDLIMDQGEGFGASTLSSGAGSQDEPSHYARFAELRFGRTYTGPDEPALDSITAEGQRRYFRGAKIAWPTVINSLAVPADGYAAILRLDPSGVDVLRELRAFDAAYTRMLAALDDAWNGPADQSWPSLGRAVFEMNELRVISCFNILRQQVPAAAVAKVDELYPLEAPELRALSDFSQPLYYGPRFLNTSLNRGR